MSLKSSRRTFLKGAGLVTCAPLIAKTTWSMGLTRDAVKNGSLHRILCCNIRVDLEVDNENGVGWKHRKDICIDIIKKYQPDIIGLQEVLRNQNEDLKIAFPDFMSFGFEGPEMDEFTEGYHFIAKNPIFFSKKRYELLGGGTFWLSETPLIGGSKSWGTMRSRQANWVRLRDKKTNTDFRVVNLHLDHKSQPAKEQQMLLTLEEAAQYQEGYPQILIGDFNSNADNEVIRSVNEAGWKETYAEIHGPAEPGFTVHGFKGENYEKRDTGRKIDFVFIRGSLVSKDAAILRDHVNGVYPSDHFFVSADVVFPN